MCSVYDGVKVVLCKKDRLILQGISLSNPRIKNVYVVYLLLLTKINYIRIMKRKLFKRYIHKEHGIVRLIDYSFEHPVTGVEGNYFKVEIIDSKPTSYRYVLEKELKKK